MSLKYRCDEKKKTAYDATKLCEASVGISTFNLFAKVAISFSTARRRKNHTELVPRYSNIFFQAKVCLYIQDIFPSLRIAYIAI